MIGGSALARSLRRDEAAPPQIVAVTHKGRRYDFPLCDLKVLDPRSPSYDLVQAYVAWFANR